METTIMVPSRHIVPTALCAAVLAALQIQPAFAAFGINNALSMGVNITPAPLPSIQPGVSEGVLPTLFPEVLAGNVKTPGGLRVDHDGSTVSAVPAISGNVVSPFLVSSKLGFNQAYNSYLFHFDPNGTPTTGTFVSTIVFDHPVIGVQLFSSAFALQKPSGSTYIGTMEGGDADVILNLGPLGVPPLSRPGYYPSGLRSRGIEEDAFMLAVSGNTVILVGSVHGKEIDEVRIFTTVPEPVTAVCWGMILVMGCAGARTWRRHNFIA